MNDIEICKRIADIDDVIYSETPNGIYEELKMQAYNPLTDDALCFQLMVKYGIDFINLATGSFECVFVIERSRPLENYDSVNDESPNKAILLAIIEANKDV